MDNMEKMKKILKEESEKVAFNENKEYVASSNFKLFVYFFLMPLGILSIYYFVS